MSAPRSIATALLLILLSACARTPPATTADGETTTAAPEPELRVRIGEVSAASTGHGAARSLRGALRGVAQRLHDDERLTRELVLDGAVSRLERLPMGAGMRVRATVSLSVRDAGGGQILVVLDSTAQMTGPRPSNEAEQDDLDREVIEGTVESLWEQLQPRIGEL